MNLFIQKKYKMNFQIKKTLNNNKDIFKYLSSFAFFNVARLVVETLAAHTYTKEVYGEFRQIWLIYFITNLIALFGISKAVLFFLSNEKNKKRFISLILVITFSLSVLFSLLLFIFSGFIAKSFSNPDLEVLIKILILYFFFSLSDEILISIYTADRNIKKASQIKIGFVFFYFIPLFLGIIFKLQLITLFKIIAISAILKYFLSLLIIKQDYGFSFPSFRYKEIKKLFTHSFPILLSNLTGIMATYLDKIIVSVYFSTEIFAVFAVGTFKLPFIEIFTYQGTGVLIPVFSKLYRKNKIKVLINLWHSSIKRIALVVYPAMVFSFFYSDELIVTLFSEKYIESSNIFRVYLLIMLFRFTAVTAILQSINRTKDIFKGSLLNLGINLIISISLINYMGYWAAVLGTVVASLVASSYYFIRVKVNLNIHYNKLLPYMYLLKTLISYIILVAVIKIITYSIGNELIEILIAGSILLPITLYSFFKQMNTVSIRK